ncbi:polysaccharide biosynthesis tyrosine autokinase [Segeticoccus rhizosphaerae]|uniref:polysaccharide biosynthesis tyrosine autokinase n=1 Tax=Segeticoccus rhizosphaerae TaxID=1104777 RepID=UPI0010BFBDC3|nr:polysaccharide biosynthesis tyrosine autokinase [Ornithinicoccus soli]
MELQDYIRIFRKRWRAILATVMVLLGLAAVASVATPKSYQASTRLFVSTAGGDTSTDLLQGSSFTQNRVTSYADVIKSPKVLNPVIEHLGLDSTADQLADRVDATVPPDSVLIQVAVTSHDPRQATEVADAIGKQFTKTVADLETVGSDQRSPVKVSVIAEPTVPTSPVSPKPARNLALGLVLGLLLGAGVAVLREMLDTRIKGEKDCEQVTDATVIGGIAYDPDAADRPLIVQTDPHSPRAEAFRSLRTNLQFVDAANHPKSIVFTSSVPDEGKTTTTANLAITLAASGAKVCAVEGDLRRPRLLSYMGMEGAVGLTSVLIGQAELDDVLQSFADTHVSVLGAGPIPPNPSELLGSPAMRDTLRELEKRFDYVIIDAPPLLPVTDAAVLSTLADGVVVIVGAGTTAREQLHKSLQSLEQVKGRLLGLVLNKLPRKGPDSYSYYRDGYAPDTSSTRVTPEPQLNKSQRASSPAL